jgi:hypothetical protein
MSKDEKQPAPPARSRGPQTLLMVGVIIVLGALGFVIGAIFGGWGTGPAPANNSAEAEAPQPRPGPTPGGGQLLPSGLRIEIIRPGTGPLVTPTDRVAFRYELRPYGGQVLESNLTAPRPAEMAVAGLVPGFQEGLTHMRPGGEARFWIPPRLGYGDSPPNGLSPTDTLEFRVKVERILPARPSAGGDSAEPSAEDIANMINAASAAEGR